MESQPTATLAAAIIAGIAAVTAAIISLVSLLKIHNKKRSDDIDLKAFQHSLDKRLKEFENTLAQTNSYLTEKGKNDATKEDIEEITAKIESIRIAYEKDAEIWRHGLSKRATLYKLQAEKEFEVYATLWKTLTELRLNFEEFRPSFDPRPVGTDFMSLRQEQKKAVLDSRNRLMEEVELNRPFVPDYLFLELRKLVQIALRDVLEFEGFVATAGGKITQEGNRRGVENLNMFVEYLDKVCNLIRQRITES